MEILKDYFSFVVYSATVSYAFLSHRHDIVKGFKSLLKGFKSRGTDDFKDIHTKLMSAFKEGVYLCVRAQLKVVAKWFFSARMVVSNP